MSKKNVLVTGDVIVDHHLYQGDRLIHESMSYIGTSETKTPGGAYLIVQLLQHMSEIQSKTKDPDGVFNVSFGLNKNVFLKLGQNLHAYAAWKLCKPCKDQEDKHWRVDKLLGYGHSAQGVFHYEDHVSDAAKTPDPDILVIDDAGLGFRSNTRKGSWPEILNKNNSSKPAWIVLKMSNPIGQGDLWRHLSTSFSDRLIVLISVDDIRKEEVKISKGISWEQSALDLAHELTHNPNIRSLLRCRHLVINFASEGALHVATVDGKTECQLIYDPAYMENEWGNTVDGSCLGGMSCLTASVANALMELNDSSASVVLNQGIKAGLAGMREMYKIGHGNIHLKKPGFRFRAVAQMISTPKSGYFIIDLPDLPNRGDSMCSTWSIMTSELLKVRKNPEPLYGIGRQVALLGPKVLSNIPSAKFGKLYTADRSEIEKLRSLHKLIMDYDKHDEGKKPLSIAVFGPPGAGKSFGIKQIAEGIFDKNVSILEFNLSQFSGSEDLIGAFHQVRDQVLKGKTPVVFWDEFDSKGYDWLQYLLAPMQDGKFQEGQLTHPIGKCIFVFAGGTSFDMENFGPDIIDPKAVKEFKLKKGPDFKSRLSGYLNVLGPNRRQIFNQKTEEWDDDPADGCFPIRRALLIRSMLKLFKDEYLQIDRGVLSALIEIHQYKHGARSMEKVLGQLKQPEDDVIRRSHIPAIEIMELHADYSEFIKIANRNMEFKGLADVLAPVIHDYYRAMGKKGRWLRKEMDVDYTDLNEDYKEDNRQAAVRIPQVLELVGLYVIPGTASGPDHEKQMITIIKQNLELLAEAEHDGWVEQKMRNNWTYGEPRNEENKIHPCMVLYKFLTEENKKKDRNSVLAYAEIVKQAGYEIVKELN